MAQEGSRGHQGSDSSTDHGSALPPAASADTVPSQGENDSNSGSLTGGIPVTKDAAGKGKDIAALIVKKEPVGSGSAGGSSRSGSGQSKGTRSAAEVVAADDTDGGTSRGGGGKRKAGVAAGMSNGAAGGDEQASPHIVTERERRKRMKNMYADLHGLLPRIPEKTDKATIVGEAINFIRLLQGTVAQLEKRKQERALARHVAAAAAAAASSSAAPPIAALGRAALPPSDLPQGWSWLPKRQQQPASAAAAAAAPAPPARFQTWSGMNVVLSVANDDAYISVCSPRRPGVLLLVFSVLAKHRIDVVTAQVASDAGRSMFSIHTRVSRCSIDPPPFLFRGSLL
ncbi:hypothetical protein EJB05_21376, partial [Eragrostis curvula]